MQKKFKKYSENIFFGVSRIILFIILTTIFYYLFNTDTVISFLEKNQISAYYIKDVILLLVLIFSFFDLLITYIEHLLKKNLDFLTLSFGFVFIILLSAYFAVGYDYGNIARSKIGWFYKIPKGESIGYPMGK